MKKLQHNSSRSTFKVIFCAVALLAAHTLSAQTAFREVSLAEPPMNSGLFSSSVAAEVRAEPDTNLLKSGTANDRHSKKTAKATVPKSDPVASPTPPRIEIMGAYARWNPYSFVNGQSLLPLKDGGVVSGTYYIDRNLGWEVEGSYYEQTTNDGRKGGAAGPAYRFVLPHVLIKLHGLAGGEKFLGPVTPNTAAGTFFANPPVWATVLTPGVSADIAIPKTRGHLALRAQVDYQYIHASYGPAETYNGGQVNINSYRVLPGLVFRLGHTADNPRRSQKHNSY